MRLTALRRARTLTFALTLAFPFALPGPAHAAPFETLIAVESENDLVELLQTEQISQETFDSLLELYRRGVDLETATREEIYSLPNLTHADVSGILQYRRDAGRIGDPSSLVTAGVLSTEKLFAMAGFLTLGPERSAPLVATAGRVRVQSQWSPATAGAPPASFQFRLKTLRHLTLGGALLLDRRRLGNVAFDPHRGALTADAPTPELLLPKAFLLWESPRLALVLGTYRIGFGERVTFDTSNRARPNGLQLDDAITSGDGLVRACVESAGELAVSPCADDELHLTPDYGFREGLLGVALGLKRIRTGDRGWLELWLFGSAQTHDVYQYELYDRATCADPSADTDECAAPEVFRRQDDPLAETSRFSYGTLPHMMRELLGGVRAAWADDRHRFGLTAWGARPDWLVEGIDLDFQEWSKIPFGGPYGAIGVDGSWGREFLEVGAELTRSFDSAPAAEGMTSGGDLGAILRGTASGKKRELELSLRYYGAGFANPYAGSVAAPDSLDGNRARDEAGARVKGTTVVGDRTTLHASADGWMAPSTGTPRMIVYGRADVQITDALTVAALGDVQDKDLVGSGDGACYDSTLMTDESGEPIPCAGEKLRVGGRARFAPSRSLWFTAQAQQAWVDDPTATDGQRRDVTAFLYAAWKPRARVRLRARTRWLDEDVANDARLETSISTYVAFDLWEPRSHKLSARYDHYIWLDDRDSTAARSPNPEHRFRLELELSF